MLGLAFELQLRYQSEGGVYFRDVQSRMKGDGCEDIHTYIVKQVVLYYFLLHDGSVQII